VEWVHQAQNMEGPMAGCHECSDEPLGSGATELVTCSNEERT
jgi:hypothetical protein